MINRGVNVGDFLLDCDSGKCLKNERIAGFKLIPKTDEIGIILQQASAYKTFLKFYETIGFFLRIVFSAS